MISGIFGKTKPINYVILLSLLFILHVFSYLYLEKSVLVPAELTQQIFMLLILLFSVLVLDFVVNRNQITSTNSYVALYFVLLAFLFPDSVLSTDAIGCNFFLILACRRLMSLRSLKNMKLKILDATLWVLAASIFYHWAILFILVVFIAIYIYEPRNLKNWLVPIAGTIAFLLIWSSILILYGKEDFFLVHYNYHIEDWDEVFGNQMINGKFITFVIVMTVTGLAVFLKSGKLGLGRIINLRFISIYFALGVVLAFLSLNQGEFPVLVTFFPAAIFLGKYTEMIKRKNIREMVLAASVLVAFLVFLFEMLSK